MATHTFLQLPVVAAGAEYLVMGYLMRRNILTYKAPPGNEGYDLICIHPDPRYQPKDGKRAQVRVQVKSRYGSNERSFPVKHASLDAFDFLVAAFLNIGVFRGRHDGLTGQREPEFYTLPQAFIRAHHSVSGGREKVDLSGLEDEIAPYRGETGFEQIADALAEPIRYGIGTSLRQRVIPILQCSTLRRLDATVDALREDQHPRRERHRVRSQLPNRNTRRADFTSYEWAQLKQAAEFVGFGMLAASGSGPIGKVRELVALASCLTPGAAPAQFSQNELVVALLEDAREKPMGPAGYLLHRDPVGLIIAVLVGRLRVLIHCERVAVLLAAKCSQAEAEGLKQWLLWIARRVAEASGDGWLGMGRKISDEEVRMLNEVATALRISTVATIPASSEVETMLGLAPPGAKAV